MSKFVQAWKRRANESCTVVRNARRLQILLEQPEERTRARMVDSSSDSEELLPFERKGRPCVIAAAGLNRRNDSDDDASWSSGNDDEFVAPVAEPSVDSVVLKDWARIVEEHDRKIEKVRQGDPIDPLSPSKFCDIFSFVRD